MEYAFLDSQKSSAGHGLMIGKKDNARLRVAELPYVGYDFVHRVLEVGSASELDACIENVSCNGRGSIAHLLSVGALCERLRICAVVDFAFVSERDHIDIEPEVESVRMHVCVHGLLQYGASVAEVFEIEILRKIVLIKAVRDEFVCKHLRCRFVYIFDGSDIGALPVTIRISP